MSEFKKINNALGWAMFAVALITYTLTVEPTASFWDCGEFIAVSYKLEVPHPPGAPLFLLIGRMFSFLAMGDVTQVAYWINMSSVISSAFTILFLFWTITLLARKFYAPHIDGTYSKGETFAVFGAGIVGSLAYTFSDSFWFSAVEAEVYAMSSFFTAFVFWAMLKWEHIEDESAGNRWIIMICYMMGLSIGVHLLNLVTIPALALIYYYKKSKVHNLKGVLLSMAAGLGIIVLIMYGVIPGLPSMAGRFEIAFVNTFGLPFGSGIIFFGTAVVASLVWAINYSIKKNLAQLNTALLSLAFILLGYSCYAIIIIRSGYNPPIDENDPENFISFVSYLKREQYGDRPLLAGPSYVSPRKKGDDGVIIGEPMYRKAEKNYVVYDNRTYPDYESSYNMLLPRIYSQQPGHPELYQNWLGLSPDERPSMGDNMRFMFTYQFGHMYFRYFLWNFSGRESDEKDAGWLGIFDAFEKLPEELANNKGRSAFFMIPFLIGMLGLFFNFFREQKTFLILMLLFFLTGLGLVLYLNSPPVEPRERDYIYVGSFYAFAIWMGFGVLAIADFFNKFIKGVPNAVTATALCMPAPILMAANGWDNHDRSGRYHSVDQAKNTLDSCAPNAILFTGGDNDTFPLWYVQEVEGYRTDVRVVVMSYFSTDWYVNQMRRPAYKSAPLPFTLEPDKYLSGINDYVPVVPNPKYAAGVGAEWFINAINKNDDRIQVGLMGGGQTAALPSERVFVKVDSAKVAGMGIIPKGKEKDIVSNMIWNVKPGSRGMFKNDLMLMDLIASNNWERPIYFNHTSANTTKFDLEGYMFQEGLAYRLLPVKAKVNGDIGEVNADVMLKNMNGFAFRGFDDPSVYHDEEYQKFGSNTRNCYLRLAEKLAQDGREKEAVGVLDASMKNLPDETIPFSYYMSRYVEMFYMLGENEKAEKLAAKLGGRAEESLAYLDKKKIKEGMMLEKNLIIINQLYYANMRGAERMDDEIKYNEFEKNGGAPGKSEAELAKINERKKLFEEGAKKYGSMLNKYRAAFGR